MISNSNLSIATIAGLITLAGWNLCGQDYEIEVQGGANIGGARHFYDASLRHRIGMAAGLMVLRIGTDRMFRYQTGIQFVEKGAALKSRRKTVTEHWYIADPAQEHWKFSYWEVPVIVSATVESFILKPYFFIGPKIGFLMTAEKSFRYRSSTLRLNRRSDTNLTDWGMDFGGGMAWPFTERWSLLASYKMSLGLRDIDPSREGTWYSRDRQILTGLRYALRP